MARSGETAIDARSSLAPAMRDVARVPSLALAAFGLFLVEESWIPSSQPDVYIFSYLRVAAIVFGVAVALYLLASLRSRRLLAVNNWAIYAAVVASVLFEVAVRSFPSLISDSALLLLPASAQRRLAGDRGLLSRDMIRGEGLLFQWKPQAKFPEEPWHVIDGDGYRNDGELGGSIDAVLLGASVLYAQTVEHDLGRRLREVGIRAHSLAFRAYGPYHYLDAYRRFIVDRGVSHAKVLVLVTTPFDLDKAIEYQRVKASGGSYEDFLARPAAFRLPFGGEAPLWVVSIFAKLPLLIAQEIQGGRRGAAADVIVRLDYQTFRFPDTMFAIARRETGWPLFEEALRAILATARSRGAEPIVLYYPMVPIAVLPYVEGHAEEKRALEDHHRETVSRLGAIVARHGGRFVDSTPWFRQRVRTEPLTIAPLDYHLNQRGTDRLFELVEPLLRPGA